MSKKELCFQVKEPASTAAAFPLFGASNIKEKSNLSFSGVEQRPGGWSQGVCDAAPPCSRSTH